MDNSERIRSATSNLLNISSALQSLSILIGHSTEPKTLLEANEILNGLDFTIALQAEAVYAVCGQLDPIFNELQKEADRE